MRKISQRDPAKMTTGAIRAEIATLDTRSSKIGDALIAAARGHERFSDIAAKTDPLSVEYCALSNRRGMLTNQLERRFGPTFPRRY